MRKHLALLLAVGLSLGGCAGLTEAFKSMTNPVTMEDFVKAEAAYGVLLSPVVAYGRACEARTIPPDCRTVVPKLKLADQKVQATFFAVRKFLANPANATVTPVSLISSAKDAITDFRSITSQYGVVP